MRIDYKLYPSIASLSLSDNDHPQRPVVPETTWPGKTEGLVFLWEEGSRTNQIPGTSGAMGRTCRVEPHGRAKFGRFWDMDLTDGIFVADSATNAALLAACRKSNEFTVEALVTPTTTTAHGPARIVSFAPEEGSGNLVIGQEKDTLTLQLRTTPSSALRPVTLCRLVAGKPQHLLITYRSGRLDCYRDGAPISGISLPPATLSAWTPQQLVFGGTAQSGRTTWAGFLEGIAISARFTPPDEAAAHYTSYTPRLKTRKTVPGLVVQGVLHKQTPTPALAEIAPYRRALAVNEYRVTRIVRGSYHPPMIAVAEWVLLDGKPLPNPPRLGRSYQLDVMKFSDYPPLESERLVSESDTFDLDLYHALQRR